MSSSFDDAKRTDRVAFGVALPVIFTSGAILVLTATQTNKQN